LVYLLWECLSDREVEPIPFAPSSGDDARPQELDHGSLNAYVRRAAYCELKRHFESELERLSDDEDTRARLAEILDAFERGPAKRGLIDVAAGEEVPPGDGEPDEEHCDNLLSSIPGFDSESDAWISRDKVTKLDQPVSLATLRTDRSKGIKSKCGRKGIDQRGRMWRRVGRTPGSHDFRYYTPSLKKKKRRRSGKNTYA
jgi:hypothetical protein